MTYDDLLASIATGNTGPRTPLQRLSDWMLTGDVLADIMRIIFPITKES